MRTVTLNPVDYSKTVQDIVRAHGGNATISRTTYTINVEAGGKKYLLCPRVMPVKYHGLAARIRKEALERRTGTDGAELWGKLPGATDKAPKFHRFASGPLPPDAVCVDISAAYPSTMQMGEMVSRETAGRVFALPKPDRLAVVGMLATRKHVTRYVGGECAGVGVVESPTRRAFFAICARVGEVMDQGATDAGADFLLYWVDGAFIRREAAPAFAEYLRGHGYRVTTSEVTNIRRSRNGNYIGYTKDGESTYLCVPSQKTVAL